MVARTSPLVHRYQESSPKIAYNIVGLKARLDANPDVMNNLREQDEILCNDHPNIERKEVCESQV